MHAFSIQADARVPYRIESVALPRLEGAAPFTLGIQSASVNPRPLGVAIDWLEIESTGAGRIAPRPAMAWWSAAIVLTALLVPWLLGAPRIGALHAFVMAGLVAGAAAVQPIAAERVLREGAWVYVAAGLASLAALALGRGRSAREGSLRTGSIGAGLAVVVLAGLAVRLALLLHPQFFYPDVRVHAVFARALARQGFVEFMSSFTANQFRYSLGLQLENGHWYAFPYPPGFYVASAPLVRWLGVAPEVAVSVVAAALNAASALLVFAIARRLRLPGPWALVASAAVPLLPLFTTRITLAYFPALAGQFLDAAVIAWVLARLDHPTGPRQVLALAALVAAALLTYTQSLVNLGLLLPGFLLAQLACEGGRARRHLGLAAGALLGAVLAFAVFYARYVPVFADMRRGVPMEGESIVLERMAQQERARVAAEELAETGVDDRYAGSEFDALRGLRKAGWRLWIFYGVFSTAVAAGFLMLAKRSDPSLARFVIVWGALFVLLNFGSGSLPGPNLLRYNKDLEIVAPLFCACLAVVGEWLARRSRGAFAAYAAAFLLWGTLRAVTSFEARVLIEGR